MKSKGYVPAAHSWLQQSVSHPGYSRPVTRPAIALSPCLTIPLAFVGGFLGLLITRVSFDFLALVGFLSLAGVIVNNGIVLIDRIDTVRAAGGDAYQASKA